MIRRALYGLGVAVGLVLFGLGMLETRDAHAQGMAGGGLKSGGGCVGDCTMESLTVTDTTGGIALAYPGTHLLTANSGSFGIGADASGWTLQNRMTSLTTVTGQFGCGNGGATCSFRGATNAATASSTVAVVTVMAENAIDANDLLFNVEQSDGTNRFTVDVEGDGVLTGGLAIGGGSAVAKFIADTTAAIDLGAAGAGAAVVATDAVTDATVGDLCQVAPSADDAAWDEGSLTCFVESAGSVKIVYHADASGGDPASMTFKILLTRF